MLYRTEKAWYYNTVLVEHPSSQMAAAKLVLQGLFYCASSPFPFAFTAALSFDTSSAILNKSLFCWQIVFLYWFLPQLQVCRYFLPLPKYFWMRRLFLPTYLSHPSCLHEPSSNHFSYKTSSSRFLFCRPAG